MKTKLDKSNFAHFERRTNILKAMAHPTRLFILELLKEGRMCVCEINELISADMSTVSKHLSVLKNAGLVSSEKEGLSVYYTLLTPCALNSLECIEAVLCSRQR